MPYPPWDPRFVGDQRAGEHHRLDPVDVRIHRLADLAVGQSVVIMASPGRRGGFPVDHFCLRTVGTARNSMRISR